MGYEKEEDYRYSAKSIEDAGYGKLFDEIKQCGERPWNVKENVETEQDITIIIEHPKYSNYSVLDFNHLYKFLTEQVKSKKKSMNSLLASMDTPFARGGTFRQGQYRVVEPPQIEHGICTAAKFLRLPLISLLAQFLEDCESIKIRLFLHAEYEETIKDFIQKAPDLVAKLRSKPSEAFTQDYQKQSFEPTLAETKYRIERVKDEKKWLNPNNFDALPLVGRNNEIKLLDNFIKSDGQFKIWAIAGPSGSGKTRLACEWAYFSDALKEWDRRVLHKEDRTEPEKWASWTPDKPTLIIIDYLYGFEDVVLKLMGRRLEPADSEVRLLLLDHIFSEPLHSDKRWGFSGDGSSHDRNEKYFFDLKPLDLANKSDQTEIIRSIIAHRAGIDKKSTQIEKAHDYLLEMEDQRAYHPLFAALVGDAIKSEKDFSVWKRRELINYYLSGEKRLPWEHEDLGLNGRWASHLIAVATARRGVAYEDLFEVANNCISAPEHFGDVQEICQKIITDDSATILKPFEPDILGESFFLKFLQFIKKSNKYKTEFRQVFMVGNEDAQTEDAIQIIAFIQRLTRNLLNDDQGQKETQELWNTLFDFMRPSDFENAEPSKWALTAGVIDIVDAIKDKNQFSKEKLISLLNKADTAAFYRIHDSSLLEEFSVLYSMRCFELTHKLTKIRPEFSEEMSALFNRYTQRDGGGETPLILASANGFCEIINALLSREVDIEAKLSDGKTALILASIWGQVEVVKLLLNAKTNIDTNDNEGRTALHWASAIGHIDVVRLLLEKEANIHAINNKGQTALIKASQRGHIDMVKLLLDEGNNIDSTDNESRTALLWASNGGYIDVVKLLLNKGANIDATDNEERNALIIASSKGHIDVVKLLLDGGTDINIANNKGYTALIWASAEGYIEMVKLLLDRGADIGATDNQGDTAFFWACDKGHVDVIKLLLENRANIDTKDNYGGTALIWASFKGHVEVVRLLLDKGASIDTIDNEKRTALHWASIGGHVDVIELLLEKDANIIHAANNIGATALHCSCDKGHVDVIRLLLDEGANIDAADNEGRTALLRASINNDVDMVKMLLDKGANIDAKDNDGGTALMWAIDKNLTDTIVKLLLDKEADVNTFDNKGRSALHYASITGQVEAVKLLLDKGANIHATDKQGGTALICASSKDHVEVVRLLLAKGINIDATDNEGCTALLWASSADHINVAILLLIQGANVHAFSDKGRTALIEASRNGNVNMVKLLLKANADIFYADNEGGTALIWASTKGHIEIVKLLLDKGANIDFTDNRGYTALTLSSLMDHVEIVKLLIDKGADIHVADNQGTTVLHLASASKSVKVVKFLLDKDKVKINTVDKKGRTALYIAIKEGYKEIANLLIKHGAKI